MIVSMLQSPSCQRDKDLVNLVKTLSATDDSVQGTKTTLVVATERVYVNAVQIYLEMLGVHTEAVQYTQHKAGSKLLKTIQTKSV